MVQSFPPLYKYTNDQLMIANSTTCRPSWGTEVISLKAYLDTSPSRNFFPTIATEYQSASYVEGQGLEKEGKISVEHTCHK